MYEATLRVRGTSIKANFSEEKFGDLTYNIKEHLDMVEPEDGIQITIELVINNNTTDKGGQ